MLHPFLLYNRVDQLFANSHISPLSCFSLPHSLPPHPVWVITEYRVAKEKCGTKEAFQNHL